MPNHNKRDRRSGDGSKKRKDKSPTMLRVKSDDDDRVEDGDEWSTQSVLSDSSWQGSDRVGGSDGNPEDDSEQENWEDKFLTCLDNTAVKSAKVKVNALKGIEKALQRKYVAEFLFDRKETVSDALLKCLKKGKGEEQELSATCLSMLVVQLGTEGESVFNNMITVMLPMLQDKSVAYKTRGTCCASLALCCFLSCYDYDLTRQLIKTLEEVFSTGFGRGENSPSLSPDQSWLITQALSAWCLLITLVPDFEVNVIIDSQLERLQELLQNSDVDLRMAAGEAIALLYELARNKDTEFTFEKEEELFSLLQTLATDSVKHRAKKDRRQQRSCFRDIQRYIVDQESPLECIKLGKDDSLDIDSWAVKQQYDNFCRVLGSGMKEQLKYNLLVRDIFGLGQVMLEATDRRSKASKDQRMFINAQAFKARTKIRGKQRDKRNATLNVF